MQVGLRGIRREVVSEGGGDIAGPSEVAERSCGLELGKAAAEEEGERDPRPALCGTAVRPLADWGTPRDSDPTSRVPPCSVPWKNKNSFSLMLL